MQDPRINWIVNPVHKHRESRGLTSAGKKFRGLRTKGHASHKLRPSRRATWKKNNTKGACGCVCAIYWFSPLARSQSSAATDESLVSWGLGTGMLVRGGTGEGDGCLRLRKRNARARRFDSVCYHNKFKQMHSVAHGHTRHSAA